MRTPNGSSISCTARAVDAHELLALRLLAHVREEARVGEPARVDLGLRPIGERTVARRTAPRQLDHVGDVVLPPWMIRASFRRRARSAFTSAAKPPQLFVV